jgi:hypothetical protein
VGDIASGNGTRRLGGKQARLRPLGGLRTDKISKDTEIVKVRTIASVRVAPFQWARFEIVVEILVRKISTTPQFFIRHCRVFGDSPRPIPLEEIRPLAHDLVFAVCKPMTPDRKPKGRGGKRDLESLTELTDPLYGPRPKTIPGQRPPSDSAARQRQHA